METQRGLSAKAPVSIHRSGEKGFKVALDIARKLPKKWNGRGAPSPESPSRGGYGGASRARV